MNFDQLDRQTNQLASNQLDQKSGIYSSQNLAAWILIGIPGSGKTTFASQLQRSHSRSLIICPDQIRNRLYGCSSIQGNWHEIWQQIEIEFKQANTLQHSVIYDATNCHRPDREAAIALAKSSGFEQISGLWLKVPLWICLMRNQRRDRQVPEEVVISMDRAIQDSPPQLQEGFSALLYPKPSNESEWMD
jgi:predicted kinase